MDGKLCFKKINNLILLCINVCFVVLGKLEKLNLLSVMCYSSVENSVCKDGFPLADGLLRKAFTSSSFQGYSFVSSLLVLLGLIKV